MNNKYHRYLMILSVLSVVLVGAIFAETVQIRRLSHKLRAAKNQQTSEVSNGTQRNLSMNEESNSARSGESWKMSGLKDLISTFNEDSCSLLAEMQQVRDQINHVSKESPQRIVITPVPIIGDKNKRLSPRADVADDGSQYVVHMDLPGMDKSDINVQVENGALTISGKRNASKLDIAEQGKVMERERFSGKFDRTIPFSENIRTDAVRAKYENGVLTVILPKGDNEVYVSPTIEIE